MCLLLSHFPLHLDESGSPRRNVMYLLRFWKTTEHNRVSYSSVGTDGGSLLVLWVGWISVVESDIVSGRNVRRYVLLQRCWNNKDPFSAERATVNRTIWRILGIIDKSGHGSGGQPADDDDDAGQDIVLVHNAPRDPEQRSYLGSELTLLLLFLFCSRGWWFVLGWMLVVCWAWMLEMISV